MSHHQNTGQNHNIKTANKSLRKHHKVQIIWNDNKNQNYIHKQTERRLNLSKAS
jgi:hypothetical protein